MRGLDLGAAVDSMAMRPRLVDLRNKLGVLLCALVVVAGCAPSAAPQPTSVARTGSDKDLILATTTSTQDSGLLDVLIPVFEQQTGYTVKTVSVGTGAALAIGARGEADVVLVHAPASELPWMQQ